ncbi:MAG TPA: toll/interleukin-1 receptor domain-containing protein [Steroidobacteraceae bacterium]
MSAPPDSSHPAPSVFLSYASEDRPAAQTLKEALAAFGLDVWYDESGLDGGDAWDQKIRRQIRECDFFLPLISAQTEARPEGYFRREWRLAVERTLDMVDDHTFLLPVVIDDTTQSGARVPEKFLSVHWLRVPGGRPTPALEALCRRLVSGQPVIEPSKRTPNQPAAIRSPAHTREYPRFPRHEPGQALRFWVQTAGWAFQSAWIFFKGFPKWVRIGVYIWLAIALMSKGCMPSEKRSDRASSRDARPLEEISGNYGRSPSTPTDTDLGSQIARQVTAEVGERLGAGRPLLAIPFSAPSEDPTAQKLADSTFAQVYGSVELSHHGQVGLSKKPLSAPVLSAAVEQGRALHSKYVLYGAVDEPVQSLTVKMVAVAEGSVLWSQSYPVANADPAKIAAEVNSKVPSLSD